MKKLLFILLLVPTIASAVSCPKWTYPENHKLDSEFNNLCQQLLSPTFTNVAASSVTATFVGASTTSVNQAHFADGTNQTTAYTATGRVLQIKISSTTTGTSTTSSTFQAVTNIKITITLSNAANTVKIWACGGGQNNAAGGNQLLLTIKRDSTDLSNGNAMGAIQNTATGQTTGIGTVCMHAWDLPGGTGPFVYQAYIKNTDAATAVSWPNPTPGWMTVEETN